LLPVPPATGVAALIAVESISTLAKYNPFRGGESPCNSLPGRILAESFTGRFAEPPFLGGAGVPGCVQRQKHKMHLRTISCPQVSETLS
jgi:hypothetical protein